MYTKVRMQAEEIAMKFKEVGLQENTAEVQIMALSGTDLGMEKMISWINQHPEASKEELLKTSRAIIHGQM